MALINQFFFVVLFITLLLLAVKYFQKANHQKIERRRISWKWLLWFNKYDIYSTTSDDYRRYMKASNSLSIALWVSVFLSVVIFLLIGYTKSKI